MHRSKSTAFTLVELLVVIGIIALLISILLPSLNRAREAAKTVQCMSNQRQLVTAAHMYANQYKQFYPRAYSSASFEYAWPTSLLPFLSKGADLWKCPSDKSIHLRSYCINYTRNPDLGSSLDVVSWFGPSGQKMTRVHAPTETVLFTCRQLNWTGGVRDIESINDNIWYNAAEQLDPVYGPGYYYPPFVTSDIYGRPHSQDESASVFAFCDGHVEKVFYPKPNDAAKWSWKWVWWQ